MHHHFLHHFRIPLLSQVMVMYILTIQTSPCLSNDLSACVPQDNQSLHAVFTTSLQVWLCSTSTTFSCLAAELAWGPGLLTPQMKAFETMRHRTYYDKLSGQVAIIFAIADIWWIDCTSAYSLCCALISLRKLHIAS